MLVEHSVGTQMQSHHAHYKRSGLCCNHTLWRTVRMAFDCENWRTFQNFLGSFSTVKPLAAQASIRMCSSIGQSKRNCGTSNMFAMEGPAVLSGIIYYPIKCTIHDSMNSLNWAAVTRGSLAAEERERISEAKFSGSRALFTKLARRVHGIHPRVWRSFLGK